jgi:hypothetical protein
MRAIVLAVSALVLAAPAPPQAPVPVQLFDQYARTGETGPASFRSTDEFLTVLKSTGRTWIEAAPAADRDRRRHLLAQLALETASATSSTRDGLLLVEWGCEMLRQQPATGFEQAWMRASASLFLRADFEARFGNYAAAPPIIRPPSAMGHLDHALARFPDEPRLQLMKILQRPEAYALSARPGADPDHLVRVPAIGNATGPRGEPRIADTIRRLSAISEPAGAGAEARAHVGWLKFHRNHIDASVDDFRAAAASTGDPFVRNLAMIGAGLAFTAQGKQAEAIGALREAADAMPGARASAILLATHLFLTGERGESAAVVNRAFGPDALELEPWRHVLQFDRLAPGDFVELRRLVGLPVRQAGTAPIPLVGIALGTDSAPVLGESSAALVRPPQQASQPFRSTANAVTLDVLVESGRVPVAGLTAADFEVLDNGERQSVEVVEVERVPVDISLVIDFFNERGVGRFTATRIDPESRRSPYRFTNEVWSPKVGQRRREDLLDVARALRASDRMRLFQVDENIANELWPMQSPPFPVERLPPPQANSSAFESPRRAATYGRLQGLYDVVAAALLRESPADRRHLVVVFTEGIDGASALPPALLLALARESPSVMYLARRETAEEFAVKMEIKGAIPYSGLLWPPDHHVIERAAESTGGSVYYHPQGTLLPDFRAIFDQFRKSYVIRYQPTSATPGWHDVTVKIAKPGKFDVNARRGYTIVK